MNQSDPMRISNILSQILFVTLICLFVACKNDNSNDAIFQRLGSDLTNVDFINSLPVELDLNILNYMYYYNGGGLAAADLDNDNLVDLIFNPGQQTGMYRVAVGGQKVAGIGDLGQRYAPDQIDHGWIGAQNAFTPHRQPSQPNNGTARSDGHNHLSLSVRAGIADECQQHKHNHYGIEPTGKSGMQFRPVMPRTRFVERRIFVGEK